MSQVVLGIGATHAPIINATLEEWLAMSPREPGMKHLDRQGNPATYEELVQQANGRYDKELDERTLTARYRAIHAGLDRLAETIRQARLDALVVIGDDQRELFLDDNLPGMLVYSGPTIRNTMRTPKGEWVKWFANIHTRYYRSEEPADYPVDRELSLHIIQSLVEDGFDLSVSRHLPRQEGEGHAFAFVHQRLLDHDKPVPIVAYFINTYFPPNQPTPRRCFEAGQALRRAVESFAGNKRIGILASGGLSHFSIDEDLDRQCIEAISAHDVEAIAAVPRRQLQAGNSEIRNWFAMSGATPHLQRQWLEYVPAYRSPAGTGTGMCFGVWS